MEVVTIVRSLDPPGRFLKRVDPTKTSVIPATAVKSAEDKNQSDEPERKLLDGWEELSDEKAIHKACQVMRDIDRADRKDREERRKMRKLKKEGKLPETPQGTEGDSKVEDQAMTQEAASDPMEIAANRVPLLPLRDEVEDEDIRTTKKPRLQEPFSASPDEAATKIVSQDTVLTLPPADVDVDVNPVTDTQPNAGATRATGRWTLEEDAYAYVQEEVGQGVQDRLGCSCRARSGSSRKAVFG
jgi:hypothetical protein